MLDFILIEVNRWKKYLFYKKRLFYSDFFHPHYIDGDAITPITSLLVSW